MFGCVDCNGAGRIETYDLKTGSIIDVETCRACRGTGYNDGGGFDFTQINENNSSSQELSDDENG